MSLLTIEELLKSRGGGSRYSHTFKDIISLDNLFESWEEFLRGKRKRKDVIEFSMHLADNIFVLHDELIEKIYTSKFSDTFSRPFAVYSQLSLMQELGIESVNVKGIMHSNGVYELGIHPMKRLYAVTMKDEQALYSVCGATGLTSEESRSRVERFFERMDERYRLLKQGNALAPSLN